MYNKNKPLASIAESQYKLAKKLQGIEEYEMPKFYKFDQLKLMQSIASSQKIIVENYNPEPGPGPEPEEKNYFYIENPANKSISVTITNTKSGAPFDSIEISNDQGSWSELTLDTNTYSFDVPAESKVYIRAEQSSWNAWNINTVGKDIRFNVGGNIMSLLYGEKFEDETTLEINDIFNSLFSYSCVVDASELILPATTLADDCYSYMFHECTSLTTAPELPATTLTDYCYAGMFAGCTSLTTAPELPATTLTDYCYVDMFQGCTSLTTAPELPATTLTDYCYAGMFYECTSLTTAPELPATTLTDYCYAGMFAGCTSLTTAPELNATILADGCYYQMFYGCTSLSEVTTYANDISAVSCLSKWLNYVAQTGTFYNLGGATYTTGESGIPSGWTEETSK